MARRIMRDDRARLASKMDASGGPDSCWMFTGARTGQGYGNIWLKGSYVGAHRAFYLVFVGPIPEGLDVDHECHNRSNCPGGNNCPHRLCVNYEEHLILRPRRENLFRGRNLAGVNSRKTHCSNGHPFSKANTIKTQGGKTRVCRTCRNAWMRENRRKNPKPRKAPPRFELKIGQRFGMLTVLAEVVKPLYPSQIAAGVKTGNRAARCRCDCGREAEPLVTHLRSGHTISCGCQRSLDLRSRRSDGKLQKEVRP